jgi:hypothetical protein
MQTSKSHLKKVKCVSINNNEQCDIFIYNKTENCSWLCPFHDNYNQQSKFKIIEEEKTAQQNKTELAKNEKIYNNQATKINYLNENVVEKLNLNSENKKKSNYLN